MGTLACQTDKPETKNIWTQYHPREMTEEQRDTILKSDGMTTFLNNIGPRYRNFIGLTLIQVVDRENWI